MAIGNVSNKNLKEARESIEQEARDWKAIGKTHWRPEDWEKIKQHILPLRFESLDPEPFRLIEAGADAMLKALIEKGEHYPGKFKVINFPTEMPAGTFIYIPDEEEPYAKSKV